VAFSGGVDSTLLLAAAKEVLKDRVMCVTAMSSLISEQEAKNAAAMAKQLGVNQIISHPAIMDNVEFLKNTRDRCRICKEIIFSDIQKISEKHDIKDIAHGVNIDDFSDYRPGIAAAKEMGIHAPLAEAGFDKQMIRSLAKEMSLSNWDRPAMACLASRIPFHTPIQVTLLRMIEKAEAVLLSSGFRSCRVRYHGEVARIEIAQEEFEKITNQDTRKYIAEQLKSIGFLYVAIDLQGYVQGSLNLSVERQPG
jgi:pyridinium-3,5-biscarboxylic acid mononucleotide sulfurtransferase